MRRHLLIPCLFVSACGLIGLFCVSGFAQVSPANPSFAADTLKDLFSYDFGSVRQGSPGASKEFPVFNRAAQVGTTSPMSLVGVQSYGQLSAMPLQTGTVTGLTAGSQAPLQLNLNTTQPGSLAVTYILEFASDSLAAAPHSFLAVSGSVKVLRHGDYDSDGDVDSVDYAFWRATVASNFAVTDGNQNGIVDSADYVIWRNNYTGPLESGTTSQFASIAARPVPEPASAAIAALSSLFLTGGLRCRSRRD